VNALGAKGDHDGAVAVCHEAIRLRPDIAFAHNSLGNALYTKGDHDGAIAAYREAIRLQPGDAVILGSAEAGTSCGRLRMGINY
jgi:Flp pilus assembly protein TadD